MGRKKKSSSGEVTIIKPSSSTKSNGTEKKFGASNQIILAMGIAGAVLGFLSGLNLWPPVPAALNSPLSHSGWLAGVLGQHHLDYFTAAQGLFLGLSVGLGISYSFNLPMRKMIMTWLLGGGGLLVGALLLKNASAAAVGWLLGLAAAHFTPSKNG